MRKRRNDAVRKRRGERKGEDEETVRQGKEGARLNEAMRK